MAEVDEHARALAELLAEQQRRAPVGDVGRVERRLEQLVLDQQLLLVGQARVQLAERLLEPAAARAQVVLARRSWCRRRATATARSTPSSVAIATQLEQVVDRLAADPGVGVRERAEPVVGVLEQVRVDRPRPAARARLEVVAQRAAGRRPRPTESAARPPARCRSAGAPRRRRRSARTRRAGARAGETSQIACPSRRSPTTASRRRSSRARARSAATSTPLVG